jgi:hypothetical protein
MPLQYVNFPGLDFVGLVAPRARNADRRRRVMVEREAGGQIVGMREISGICGHADFIYPGRSG